MELRNLQGAGQPILVLVFTKTLDTAGQGQTEEELRDNIKVLTVYFMLIGAGMGLCSAIGRSCLKLTATNIGMQTKAKYVHAQPHGVIPCSV